MAGILGLGIGLPFAAALNAGGGVSPVTILGSKLAAWWTADRADLITLSGSAVTSWKDVVAGYDAVQALSASRPIYSATSFNGKPGLTFDGADDELTLASQPFPSGANPGEILGIVQQDALTSDTSTRRWFAYGGATNNDSRFISRSGSGNLNRAAFQVGTGAAAPGASVGATDFSTRHVHRGVVTGSQIRQYIDGNLGGSDVAAVPATGSTRARIGASTGGIGYWNGKIRDVIVTNALLTEDEVAALLAWALPRRML